MPPTNIPTPPLQRELQPRRAARQICPVPPTPFTPDSSNQFYGPQVPTFRTFATQPLSQQSSGGGTTIENATGSGSGSTVINTTALSIKTASVTTPVLNPNNSAELTTTVARAYVLFNVTSNAPCRIRIYATQAAQIADLSRSATTALNFQTTQGVIADVNLTSAPFSWLLSPPANVMNGDNPTSPNAYISVTNTDNTSVPITVTLTYVPFVA